MFPHSIAIVTILSYKALMLAAEIESCDFRIIEFLGPNPSLGYYLS